MNIFGIRLRRSIYRTRSRRLYSANKETARLLIHERVKHWSAFYGVKAGRIAIRNQKSRWGSCSKKGNLNFNYKLTFLPPEIRDYVIIHEICHLKEFNHGKKFWELVAETAPNFKELRKRLRKIHAE